MLLDSLSETGAPPRERDAPTTTGRIRLRFRKSGDLRLVSHHDLMHCFERMLRRAALPFCSTQGFHPKPRMSFALSLALGIIGCEEVVELELVEPFDSGEVCQRLACQSPPGLEILDVRRLPPHTRAQVCRATYRAAVPAELRSELPERIAQLLHATEWWVERTRPRPRRLELRPFLRDVRMTDDSLEIDLWVSPAGMARPEEVLRALGLEALLDNGVILERTKLELADELPEQERAQLPALPTHVKETAFQPANSVPGEESPETEDATVVVRSTDRSSPPAPLLPGPLSFES
jgi:radical SAM-linked protein